MSTLKGSKLQVSTGRGQMECTVSGDGQCRSCDGFVIWVRTPSFKNMPVDPRPDAKTGLYVSHFSTCPEAGDWRRS